MPQRIQRSRAKGSRMPDRAAYVGRPTCWGNPFTMADAREAGYVGTDAELARMCVAEYRTWLLGYNSCHQDRYFSGGRWYDRTVVRDRVRELAGRDLACWCPLEDAQGRRAPCHADVLLGFANPAVAGGRPDSATPTSAV